MLVLTTAQFKQYLAFVHDGLSCKRSVPQRAQHTGFHFIPSNAETDTHLALGQHH